MDAEIVEKGKDFVEVEFDEKEVPIALVGILQEKGVDSFWYEPHPLLSKFRIKVISQNAEKDLKAGIKDLGQEWGKMKKAVLAKL